MGAARTQHDLGLMYRQGRGVAQDDAEAAKWYRRAAEQGHSSAQLGLGFMYSQGRGVSQDYTNAAKWFRKAADHCETESESLHFM